MKQWRKWSAEDDALLKAAIASGLPPEEVGKQIGRTAEAVRNRRYLLHLPYFIAGRYKARLATIRQLHWLGKTAAEAAAITGLCIGTVNSYRRDMDLPPFSLPNRPPRADAWSAEDDARLEAAIAAGMSLTETAQSIGRSLKAVGTRRMRLGLPRFKRRPRTLLPGKWPSDRVKTLADLLRGGRSYREIAATLEVSRNAVAGAIRDHIRESANA